MVDGQRSVAGHGRCLCLSILFMLSAALHLALLLWPLIHPSSYYGFPNTNNLIAEGLFVEHDIRFRPSLALVPLLPSITLIRVSITFIMGIVLLVFGNSIKLNNLVVHQWICHGHTQLYIVSPHGYNCACTLLFMYVIRLNTLFSSDMFLTSKSRGPDCSMYSIEWITWHPHIIYGRHWSFNSFTNQFNMLMRSRV